MLRAKPRRPSGPACSSPETESVRWIHCHRRADREHERRGHRCDADLAAANGRRLPNRMMTKKATPGMTGISHAFSRNQPRGDGEHAVTPSSR